MLSVACRRAARPQTRSVWNAVHKAPSNDYEYSAAYIRLTGIPKTACNADIKRLLDAAGVTDVKSVLRAYHRFEPQEVAFVHFPHASAATLAASRVRSAHSPFLSGHHITASVSTGPPDEELRRRGWLPRITVGLYGEGQRTRGHEGKAEAAARGLVDGNGFGASVSERAQNVVISGLPAGLDDLQLKRYFGEFKFVTDGKHAIVPTAHSSEQRRVGQYLLRLRSVAEAHRMARHLHKTMFAMENGHTTEIEARVIY